ncbi:MAG: hypothetical protein RLY78_4042 [Pseudomonadota bacterium]|jgi:feruloyl esterase
MAAPAFLRPCDPPMPCDSDDLSAPLRGATRDRDGGRPRPVLTPARTVTVTRGLVWLSVCGATSLLSACGLGAALNGLWGTPRGPLVPPALPGVAQVAKAAPAAAAIASAAAQPVWVAAAIGCRDLPDALGDLRQVHPALRLDRVRPQEADAQGHPAHCVVQGRLNRRTGADGRDYAIRFELRLPERWNRRLLHTFDGGPGGQAPQAWGRLGVQEHDALSQGWAVLASDEGHDAQADGLSRYGLVQPFVFALEPQARRDLAGDAAAALAPLAGRMVGAYYRQPARHRYAAGCSDGGRQVLAAAARRPQDYDGYLAGAPQWRPTASALQHAWDLRQFQPLGDDLRRAFSPVDLRRVADWVVERCDVLDQLRDGQVLDVRRCQSRLRWDELRCREGAAGTGANCLRAEQVEALRVALGGPQNRAGQALYVDWPLDVGIASAAWRRWKLETDIEAWQQQPIGVIHGGAALAYLWRTPPQTVAGTPQALREFLQQLDLDEAARAAGLRIAPYEASARELFDLPADLPQRMATLRQRGGRLLIYHGSGDAVVSPWDSTRWIEQVQSALGQGAADETARLFLVPGMGHCQGGPATDRFDALQALTDWVEQGEAPQRIEARTRPDNGERPAAWSPVRSRPLCPWPRVPRYGGGDPEEAASFRCSAG